MFSIVREETEKIRITDWYEQKNRDCMKMKTLKRLLENIVGNQNR